MKESSTLDFVSIFCADSDFNNNYTDKNEVRTPSLLKNVEKTFKLKHLKGYCHNCEKIVHYPHDACVPWLKCGLVFYSTAFS